MKKFLLINSPIYWDSTKEDEQYLPPLGLGYIATYLEKAGIDIELIDCVKERLSVLEIIDTINAVAPEYMGINIFTQNYELVKYIVEHIETDCHCIIGGQAVKSLYQELLKWNTDNKLSIVIGEGEFLLPQIVLGTCIQKPEIQNGRKWVYRINSTSPYFPNDISNIYLNRKYLGNEIIVNHYGEKELSIITSRGCTYNCAFCGGAKSLNEDVPTRIRTEDSIIREIGEALELHPDVMSVRILDDLFLRNRKSIDIANSVFSRFPKISWRGMAHVLSLYNALDRIKELHDGNCKELFIGIESGSERVRKHINKLGDSKSIICTSKEILKNGIDLKGYFIYGFPNETEEDFKKTYDLASEIKRLSLNLPGTFRTSVFQFRPYHGTQLYNEIVNGGGKIYSRNFNDSISLFEGRSQFNFDFGNYSEESDELLNEYIIKTQSLSEVQ